LRLAQPLRLDLSPSGGYAALVVALHAAASACVLAVLPGAAGWMLAAALLALGVAAARDRALLRGPRAPRAIEIAPGGQARLVLADGATAPLGALRGIGVARHWVALKVGSPARRGLLVTSGMLAAEPLRRLRLWALWQRQPGVAPGQRTA
jgi:hypothetical protein